MYFYLFSVTVNRKSSASKQRQELTSWLLPSERQKYKPLYEQNDFVRYQTKDNIFGNGRQVNIAEYEWLLARKKIEDCWIFS